jgi:uncharacterized protein with HEPN domain
MPPSLGDRLEHILECINSIRLMLASDSIDAIAGNRAKRLALEREFEIICEASRYVPGEIKATEPGIDWHRMVDLGNRLRHAYHRIQIEILVQIAQADLPQLKDFIERVLAQEAKR